MSCPDEATLRALSRGELERGQAFTVRAHVRDCERCTAVCEGFEVEAPVQRHLGRYLLLDELGRGGMGRVFRGFDPQLERFVAIKQLLDAGQGPEGPQRLLREAQAMAKLVHPNIVSVFDAGLTDGDVFLVMEFVKGPTLAQWLKEAPRTWREVLRVFLDAGRGLEAAHAAALVHRDFKPSNVLVHEGHAKVTDFGLALLAAQEPAAEDARADSPSQAGAASRLTRAGATPGTPEYMAPEQFQGRFDARSDQFSFARALHEALRGRGAPGWLEAPLGRALSQAPEARFPSMGELLAALSPEARQRRRTVALGVGAAVLLSGLAAVGARTKGADCAAATAALDAVWTQAARRALDSHAQVLPAASARAVTGAFDAWAADWSQRARASCEASASGLQSEKVELLRRLCFERQLTFFTTVVGGLQETAVGGEQLVGLADALQPGGCDEAALLAEAAGEEPVALREQLEPLRRQLQRVEGLILTGRRELALTEVSSCLEAARAVGFDPFTAEPAVLKGQLLTSADPPQARALFEEAYVRASDPRGSSETQRVAARAALDYFSTFEAEPQALDALKVMADAALVRAGRTERAEAAYLLFLGKAALSRGDGKEAATLLRRCVSLREKLFGPGGADTLVAKTNLALALELVGDSEGALALLEEVVARQRARFGDDALPVARALAKLGAEEVMAVRYAAARKHLEEASGILTRAGQELGRESELLDNLASMQELEGDFAAARARRVTLLQFERDPLQRAKFQGLMSRVLVELGESAAAKEAATEAIAVLEKASPTHPDLQVPLTTLGRVTPGPAGAALLERALALPRSVDFEYRGDVYRALAARTSGNQRAALLTRARADYAQGEVAFRVSELDAALAASAR